MKKLKAIGLTGILAVVCMELLSGCDDCRHPREATNLALCRQSVVDKFGGYVSEIPGQKYRYIARDTNGAVWYVETLNTDDAKVSAQTQLLPSK